MNSYQKTLLNETQTLKNKNHPGHTEFSIQYKVHASDKYCMSHMNTYVSWFTNILEKYGKLHFLSLFTMNELIGSSY